jgi:hypothetical protein
MNDFEAQHSILKQILARVIMEANEKDSILEELGAELEAMRIVWPREEANADEIFEKKADAESVEDPVDYPLSRSC